MLWQKFLHNWHFWRKKIFIDLTSFFDWNFWKKRVLKERRGSATPFFQKERFGSATPYFCQGAGGEWHSKKMGALNTLAPNVDCKLRICRWRRILPNCKLPHITYISLQIADKCVPNCGFFLQLHYLCHFSSLKQEYFSYVLKYKKKI